MERKELTIRIVISPGLAHAGLIALLLASFPAALGSETVTLQTYYPAPYGIYQQLRTMNITTLAESGGAVAIGTQDPAGNKLRVTGGSTRLDSTLNVTSGEVNIGAGNLNVTGSATVTGNMGVGTGAGPTYRLDVTGKAHASNYIKVDQSGCTPQGGSNAGCSMFYSGNAYATWVPGIFTYDNWYQARPGVPQFGGFYGFNVYGYADGEAADQARFLHYNYDVVEGIQFWCCPTT